MRLPKKQCRAGLLEGELAAKTISQKAHNRGEEAFLINFASDWRLRMKLEGNKQRQLHNVRLELYWTNPGASAPSDQRASTVITGSSDAGSTDPVPTFSLHRQLANLIEGSTHASYDSLAAEAARVVFQSCEAILIPPQRAYGFSIKFGEVRSSDNLEAHPQGKKVYHFNAQEFADFQRARKDNAPNLGRSRAFIALGSNVGDRTRMMEEACSEMGRRDLKVLRTSSLYETEPMYKTDQPPFMNGVCEVCALRMNPAWVEDVY